MSLLSFMFQRTKKLEGCTPFIIGFESRAKYMSCVSLVYVTVVAAVDYQVSAIASRI